MDARQGRGPMTTGVFFPVSELLGRRGRVDKVRIPWARPSVYDRHAQPEGIYACVDRTGRRREEHEFVILTRRGMGCLWCDKVRGWEAV